jgi:hypothetical protein
MKAKVSLSSVYTPSDDIVAREIEGEIIIVPITAGIGDMEDELFTLNETGRAIWKLLDGTNRLKDIVTKLAAEFKAPVGAIEKDVVGFVTELSKRKILVEASDD